MHRAPNAPAPQLAFPALTEDRWMSVPLPLPMPQAALTGMAPVNGIQMYFATYGAGSPVLLVHGGLSSADVWSAQVADLMQDHLVIVADSRGHGRSTGNTEPFSFDLMSSDYLALLDYLKIDRVDLVGWSDGANIGLNIAMTHPERLKHVFAQAGNITTSGTNPEAASDPVLGNSMGWLAQNYAKLSPTPGAFEAFVAQIFKMWESQPNWSDAQVAAIKVPKAVVVGDHDELILPEHSRKIAALIPGAVLVILPDTSHFAMLQAPDEYTSAVRAVIDA